MVAVNKDGGTFRRRRKRDKRDKLRRALGLFAFSLCVLWYTWSSVFRDSSSNETTLEQTLTKGMHLNQSSLKRAKQRQQRLEKENRGKDKQESLSSSSKKSTADAGAAGGGSGDGGGGGLLAGVVGKIFKEDKEMEELDQALEYMDLGILHNTNMGMRWVNPDLLPALTTQEERPLLKIKGGRKRGGGRSKDPRKFFATKRMNQRKGMEWETEEYDPSGPLAGVDFTKHSYEYPETLMEPPATLGDYPSLRPMKDIMADWPQDDIDAVPNPFPETLLHFDYTDPKEVEAARLFRDAKLPFKFTNVPEVVQAGIKWTDEYLSTEFTSPSDHPPAQGTCQESPDNYFAFFNAGCWNVRQMGIPPTRNNDWTFAKWAEHARYADATGLDAHQAHFYWQAGVPREERYTKRESWTFISRDLPSFSSSTETFFVFEPDSQKGIQCRFGERGVTAATHYDAGRNMIAMMTGAKRYILSPPRECSRLGIVNERGHSIFRHSMLNFGHLNHMDNTEMPDAERAWMERSGDALAVETVLKAGEVLYIPSHWFHYITSLQKSAQCNVRSGVDLVGDRVFGGQEDVLQDRCSPI